MPAQSIAEMVRMGNKLKSFPAQLGHGTKYQLSDKMSDNPVCVGDADNIAHPFVIPGKGTADAILSVV